ncbi:MAG TPA: hypothetical protein DCQ92_10605 [Verrucomicrobia subdivision 3 bacterium]|nr:hypothetical protein [Limisphaerales bacterium]
MSDELPKGWTEITLQDAGAWRSGGTPSRQRKEFFGKGVPWVKSGDLPDGPILKTQEEITKLGLENSAAKLMPAGTISMALYGATIGKLGLMTFPAATNQACANVIPDTRLVEPQFLFNYLFSERRNFIEQGQGGAQPNISQEIVRSHPFPLAPLAEQRRIVAKLERLLGQVDACQQRLEKLPMLLKRFRQSVLAAACSGRLTADWREENDCTEDADELLNRMKLERRERWAIENGNRKYREADPVADEDLPTVPETWRWTNFDHCAWEITVGHVGPMKDRYVEKGVTFLRCQNVRPLKFDTDGLVHIPADFHKQLSKSELLGGEILVVRSGANTGDCCVFPRSLGAANCSDLVITRPLSGLSSEYGALYVNSPAGQALLTLHQTGIAQPHFNIGAMRVKAFPLPPLAEQQEIVRRVAGLFALADQLEMRLAQARGQVAKLTPALLARAFAGQLVPQNPKDEPASALLERIKVRA